ncbi:MAG: hypothetical protein ACI4PG_04090 [Candidatus Ventricola sp.]
MLFVQILWILAVIAFAASAVLLLGGLIPSGAGVSFIGKAAGFCAHTRKGALIGLLVSLAVLLIAYPRAEKGPGLPSPSMTTIGAFSEELAALADRTPTALVYTESIGAPGTFTVTVDDPAVVRQALGTILRTPVSRKGCQVDMAQLQYEEYRFIFGEEAYTFGFLPHSYFCYDGQDYELGGNQLDRVCSLVHEWAAQQEERMKPQSKWYGEDAVLETRFVDNGDEARSVTELTLTAGGKTLTGIIEGAYDVLSVEKQPDGYVISYTYGDFYSHDAVRSSRLTVENGKLIIAGLAQ